MASSTFPQYSDGNVEIHFSTSDDKYVLHCHALALHSDFFKASLSERWNGGAEATLVGGKNHWVYELRFDKDSDLGHLLRKATGDSSPPADTELILGSKGKLPANISQAEKKLHEKRVRVLKAHQNLLGALYHIAPDFDHASFDAAKSSVLNLAMAAEQYGAQKVVKIHIRDHLQLYQTEIHDLCSKTPLDMLELGLTVKSPWIFMEAATNIIGRSKRCFEEAQPRLVELRIADLMNKKRAEFEKQLQACEFAMFLIQADIPATNVYESQAVYFFRQWLSKHLIEGGGSTLSPGYARLYRSIAMGGFPLSMPSNRELLRSFILTYYNFVEEDQLSQYDGALRTVFTKAANILRPIMVDRTRRQEKTMDVFRTLTFAAIEDDELPWLQT